MRPTGRLLWILAGTLPVAALPALVAPVLWIAVAALWTALALGVSLDLIILLRARPALNVTFQKTVGVGDSLEVSVQVRSRAGRGLRARLLSEVESPLSALPPVEAALPDGTSGLTLTIEAHRRGEGRILATWLELVGPLRLLSRISRFAADGQAVRVIPNVPHVRRLALEHFGATSYRGGIRIERLIGDGTEIDSLEAYVQGMDIRDVDWKASARHHGLMARRRRLERNQRLVLCLDTGRLMADPLGPLARLDHGIHSALLLAWAASRAGDLVGLQAYGREPLTWIPPAAGNHQVKRLIQACSALRPEDDETNHVLGLTHLTSRLKRRSLVVVFTDFADSTSAELMVEHLGRAAQRHLVVFVALDDPLLLSPLETAPARPADLAAAVVASELRRDRRRVLRRLARMGVDVVTGPPGRAPLFLLQRYLHIKRRGLIG